MYSLKLPIAAFFILALAPLAALADAAQKTLSDADVLAMGGNKYAFGELPLGDDHYVTQGPRKGFIYLCRVPPEMEGGAQFEGPWIHGEGWNPSDKPAVAGRVEWPDARFYNILSGDARVLSGNGLPISHPTGMFPIQSADPAARYDRNPNHITAQSLSDTLPASPVYSETPFCMGMEVGMMLSGVPLLNGFDAGLRDAAAHEVQDSCGGHPQKSGQYHYHSLSACFKDASEKTVLGYALDGFPITGPMVAPGKYLTTDDLDECHGLTSEITEDGRARVTYHYVMTPDFPYSVSCFRARPVRVGPSGSGPGGNRQPGAQSRQEFMPVGDEGNGNDGMRRGPPAEAVAACNGGGDGSACAFTSPRGDQISGTCRAPPGMQGLVCVPVGGRP